MRTMKFAGLVCASALLVAACGARGTTAVENEETAATNLQPADVSSVAARVSVARCLRERTCDHIGTGRAFSSLADCEAVMKPPTQAQVPNCEKFDGVVLDECTHDIRALRCGSNLDTVERIESCRQSRLCK